MAILYPPRQVGNRVQVCGRLSYAHLFEPRSVEENGDKKYSCTLLIPKTDKASIEAINNAYAVALETGKAKFWQKGVPAAVVSPLKDGDLPKASGEPTGPEYKGHYYIYASTAETRPPKVANQQKMLVTDRSEVYSGCYAYVDIDIFAFDKKINKGITAGLNNVMKVADGDPLGGGAPSIEDSFDFVNLGLDDL